MQKNNNKLLFHLDYVKLPGFHGNQNTILKHGHLFFYTLPLIFKVFIIIDEYAILIILISDHWVKALCHNIKLVPVW